MKKAQERITHVLYSSTINWKATLSLERFHSEAIAKQSRLQIQFDTKPTNHLSYIADISNPKQERDTRFSRSLYNPQNEVENTYQEMWSANRKEPVPSKDWVLLLHPLHGDMPLSHCVSVRREELQGDFVIITFDYF